MFSLAVFLFWASNYLPSFLVRSSVFSRLFFRLLQSSFFGFLSFLESLFHFYCSSVLLFYLPAWFVCLLSRFSLLFFGLYFNVSAVFFRMFFSFCKLVYLYVFQLLLPFSFSLSASLRFSISKSKFMSLSISNLR